MKVIIAGSRTINNYNIVEPLIDAGVSGLTALFPSSPLPLITCVISGGASGPDRLGVRWAYQHKIPFDTYLPDWGKYHRSAGIRRNVEMGEVADAGILIWDGVSRGTLHMIEYMDSVGKPMWVEIVNP